MAKRGIRPLALMGGVALLCSQGVCSASEGPAATATRDLGKVHFVTSCNPAVQAQFDEAMVLLYAFWSKDAIAGFKKVLQQDPECAIADWGIAMAYQGNPLTAQQPTPEA